MKRIAIKLVVFLLLGAVVNVGVAWGCLAILPADYELWPEEILSDVSAQELGHQFVKPEFWPAQLEIEDAVSWRAEDFASPQYLQSPQGYEFRGRGYRGMGWCCTIIDAHYIIHDEVVPGHIHYVQEVDRHFRVDRVGWWMPVLAVVHGEGVDEEFDFIWVRLDVDVLVPGFLINTLFYAVILWLLWSAPFATRRLIRKRGGRCVKCGYDLRHAEHDACPECGEMEHHYAT